ncbi:MAG: hypothetical protein J6I97_07405 [Agathobacter sp.]|nr:hypothetical protein [Agathobacter sp.]
MIRFCSLYTYLKDLIGKEIWENRRHVVEIVTFGKMLLPVLFLLLLRYCMKPKWLCIVAVIIIGYGLIDTVTYLIELIVLADIQSPSANIIRSIIMLFLNYFEATFAIATIGYACLPNTIGVKEILTFAMLGTEIQNVCGLWRYIILSFMKSIFI